MVTNIYRLKRVEPSDQLGAALILANVDVHGYTEKDLTTAAMKNSITFFLKQYGLNVSSVSASKSSSGLTYINIVVVAKSNTSSELQQIKDSVNAVMSSILPLGKDDVQASFAGSAALTVTTPVRDTSTFTFQMIGIGSGLSARHAQFNQAFVRTFPKLLYTNPSTSFSEPIGIASIGGESQIQAIGDTRATPEITKTVILNLLRNADIPISSNINFTQLTAQQLQQGAILTPPVNTSFVYNDKNYKAPINSLIPGGNYSLPDLSKYSLPDLSKVKTAGDFGSYEEYLNYLKNLPNPENWLETLGKALGLDSLAKSFGLVATTATITAVAVGGVFLLVMLKR